MLDINREKTEREINLFLGFQKEVINERKTIEAWVKDNQVTEDELNITLRVVDFSMNLLIRSLTSIAKTDTVFNKLI